MLLALSGSGTAAAGRGVQVKATLDICQAIGPGTSSSRSKLRTRGDRGQGGSVRALQAIQHGAQTSVDGLATGDPEEGDSPPGTRFPQLYNQKIGQSNPEP